MIDIIGGIVVGVLLGAILAIVLMKAITTTPTAKYEAAILECEKNLPRSKKCKIIGVIDE